MEASTLSPQFAIGTFTADATSQTLTIESPGFGNAHITGYQVRTIPVPEPTSAALLGLGGLALVLRRRKS